MDKICAISERLITWISSQERVPLHFVGTARSYRTAPAPYLELVYMAEGCVPELAMGGRSHAIPAGHVALHNVHFGNLAPKDADFRAWVAFLRIEDEPAFADLAREPWLLSLRTPRPLEWLEKFERLAQRARATGWVPRRYSPRQAAALSRDGDLSRETGSPRDARAGGNSGGGRSSGGGGRGAADLFVKTALLDLFGQLLDDAAGAAQKQRPARHEAIEHALDFMAAHYAQPAIRLRDVAAAAGLSVDHLGRLFNQHVGESPMRRLRALRIERSAFLLRHTDMRVEDVAREVGFEDPFHFSRAFKGIRGMSPKAYRNRV